MPEQSGLDTDFPDVHMIAERIDLVAAKTFRRVKPLKEYLHLPFHKGEKSFTDTSDRTVVQQFEFAYFNTSPPLNYVPPPGMPAPSIPPGADPYEEYSEWRVLPEFTAEFILKSDDPKKEKTKLAPPNYRTVLENDIDWACNMIENDMGAFDLFWYDEDKEFDDDTNLDPAADNEFRWYKEYKKKYHDWNCDAYYICNDRPCGDGCVHFRLAHSTVNQDLYMWRNFRFALGEKPGLGEACTMNQMDFKRLRPYHLKAESAITCAECEVKWPEIWKEGGGDVTIYDKEVLRYNEPAGCVELALMAPTAVDPETYRKRITEWNIPSYGFKTECIPLVALIQEIPFADEIDRYEENKKLYKWKMVSMCNGHCYLRMNLLKWLNPRFVEDHPNVDPEDAPWDAFRFLWAPTAIRIELKGKWRPAIRAAWYDFMYHTLRHSIGVRGNGPDASLDEPSEFGSVTGEGTTFITALEELYQPCFSECGMFLQFGLGWLPPDADENLMLILSSSYGELLTERLVCAKNKGVCDTLENCVPTEDGVCDKISSTARIDDTMKQCDGCFCSPQTVVPAGCDTGTCDSEIELPWYGGCMNSICDTQTGEDVPEGKGEAEAEQEQQERPGEKEKHPDLFKVHAYTYNLFETLLNLAEAKIDEEFMQSRATSGWMKAGGCGTCLGPLMGGYYINVPEIEIWAYYYKWYYEYYTQAEERPTDEYWYEVGDDCGLVITNIRDTGIPGASYEFTVAVDTKATGIQAHYTAEFMMTVGTDTGCRDGAGHRDVYTLFSAVANRISGMNYNIPVSDSGLPCNNHVAPPPYDHTSGPFVMDQNVSLDVFATGGSCVFTSGRSDVPGSQGSATQQSIVAADTGKFIEKTTYDGRTVRFHVKRICLNTATAADVMRVKGLIGMPAAVTAAMNPGSTVTGQTTVTTKGDDDPYTYFNPYLSVQLNSFNKDTPPANKDMPGFSGVEYKIRCVARLSGSLNVMAGNLTQWHIKQGDDEMYIKHVPSIGGNISVLYTFNIQDEPVHPQPGPEPGHGHRDVSLDPHRVDMEELHWKSNDDDCIWPVSKLFYDKYNGWNVKTYCDAKTELSGDGPVLRSDATWQTMTFHVSTNACSTEDPPKVRPSGWAAILWGEWLAAYVPSKVEMIVPHAALLAPPWAVGMCGDKLWDDNGDFLGGAAEFKCLEVSIPGGLASCGGPTWHEAYRSRGGFVNITPFIGPFDGVGERTETYPDGTSKKLPAPAKSFLKGNTYTLFYQDLAELGDKVMLQFPPPPESEPPAHYRRYVGVYLEVFTHGNVGTPDMLLPFMAIHDAVNWEAPTPPEYVTYTTTPEEDGCLALANIPPGEATLTMVVKEIVRLKKHRPWDWEQPPEDENQQ